MKVVVVTQYYEPENAWIPNNLAEELADRGHDVRVLTGFPNYPLGRLYPGFRQRPFHSEIHGRVKVRRVPLIVSHSLNPFARIANYMSFAISSLGAQRFVRDADVMYVYATQMTAAIAPHIWNVALRIPFVLHIQDLWPESVTGSSMIRRGLSERFVNGVLNPWIRAVYRRAAGVIAIAPTMGRMLTERGVGAEKLHIVLNWGDERRPSEIVAKTKHLGLTVVYAGNLGPLQDLETVVDAARQVTDLAGFRLLLVGSGVIEDELKLRARGLTNVEFCGRIPTTQMNQIYAKSDFQLVTLRKTKISEGTIPSKLQGSFANGVPVISTVAGDVSNLVRDYGAGLTSTPGDKNELAKVFRAAYALSLEERRTMGEMALSCYADLMSKSKGIDRIEEILANAANLPERERINDRKF